MQVNLEKVLKRASKGHNKSQLFIYEEFYGYCMSVALRFGDSRESAKEIVHDSFLKAFKKLDTVLKTEAFKPWLRRIVVNTSIDHYRKEVKQQYHLDVVEESAQDMSEGVLDRLSAEDILAAVAQLSTAYRLVFTLYAVEGYKHEEIANKLGISVGTSKSNLSKARAKLQKVITEMDSYNHMSNG